MTSTANALYVALTQIRHICAQGIKSSTHTAAWRAMAKIEEVLEAEFPPHDRTACFPCGGPLATCECK